MDSNFLRKQMGFWLFMSMFLINTTHVVESKVVTAKMEKDMREAITEMVDMMVDSEGMRFLVPGIIRLCFHDCLKVCDGCIDTRRIVQGGNNGLLPTWIAVKTLWFKRFQKFCSMADFVAFSCSVAADFAGQRGEEELTCVRTLTGSENDCRPHIPVLWGRETCPHAQKEEEVRDVPDANQNPYEWFKDNFNFEPKEAACIMGSHSLGKLRANETGFEGNFTRKHDVLSNLYYKEMLDPAVQWKQERIINKVDNETLARFQWHTGVDRIVRVNSDMMLLYEMKPAKIGKVSCESSQTGNTRTTCKQSENMDIIVELANDNKEFIKCFGEAMAKVTHTGYEIGKLVPTGEEFMEPTTQAPETTTVETKTTTTTKKNLKKTRQEKRAERRANRKASKDTKTRLINQVRNISPFSERFKPLTTLFLQKK